MATSIDGHSRKKPRLTRAGEWYDARLDVHQALARKVRALLEEILHARGIQFDRVTARVKTRKSFLEKADKKEAGRIKYGRPIEEIKDLIGVRVVTYLESTVKEVSALIEGEFSVDPKNSLDKGESLGTDRVGYKSRHYVATLGPKRDSLLECADFKDVPFEIQVRSLLQHAWAEMEHDRRFKYHGELPADIKRRFSILAGHLELGDREFNSIAREIDERAAQTARSASGRDASDRLTVVNATEYLRGILAEYLPSGLVEPGLGGDGGAVLMDELERFGVTTLGGLAALFPRSLTSTHPELLAEQTTFIGLLRNAMIFADAGRYFADVWQGRWQLMDQSSFEMFRKCGVELEPLLAAHGIVREEEFAEDDEYSGVPDSEMDECGFCGSSVPQVSLTALGAGGQEAPLACPSCVNRIDDEARGEHAESREE
jgi:putative GTP pyrophosphokinase